MTKHQIRENLLIEHTIVSELRAEVGECSLVTTIGGPMSCDLTPATFYYCALSASHERSCVDSRIVAGGGNVRYLSCRLPSDPEIGCRSRS